MEATFIGYSDDVVEFTIGNVADEFYPPIIGEFGDTEVLEVGHLLGVDQKLLGRVLAFYNGAWGFAFVPEYDHYLESIERWVEFKVYSSGPVAYSQIGVLTYLDEFTFVVKKADDDY